MRDERGVTLVELLVFMMLSALMMGVIVQLITVSARTQPEISNRNAAITHARVLGERLTRELRLSDLVEAASPSAITFRTWIHRNQCGGTVPATPSAAIQCRVTYSCASGTCTRTEGNPDGSGTPKSAQLVSGITNSSDVFSYQPVSTPLTSIGYVVVRLVFPAEEPGEDAITIQDGTGLRNR